jgi:hypothetical protein
MNASPRRSKVPMGLLSSLVPGLRDLRAPLQVAGGLDCRPTSPGQRCSRESDREEPVQAIEPF